MENPDFIHNLAKPLFYMFYLISSLRMAIVNYELWWLRQVMSYECPRAEPIMNYSLFIIHYSLFIMH